jgi:predicted transcriptional regulator
MIVNVMDMLFGCWHTNYSFPITAKTARRGAASVTGTYIVCLECGKEFPYDWKTMKVVSAQKEAKKEVTPGLKAEPLVSKQAA